MRRLLRFIVVLTGVVVLVGILDRFLTHGAMTGQWQLQAQELSEQATDLIVEQAGHKAGAERSQAGGSSPLGRDIRKALTRVGNRLMGALASNVVVTLTDGGFRFEGGGFGTLLASSYYQGLVGSSGDLSGCSSGTYTAAFPLMHVTCGDGSGRSLWLLMKGWPGSELRLLPLPLGNEAMQERVKTLAAEERPSREKLAAIDELMTLVFMRPGPGANP